MDLKNGVVLAGLVLLFCPPTVQAADSCAVGFSPKTSGFALNPILDKLTVTSAKPATARDFCQLQVNDQILQVNDRPILGARALAVMKYWKSLKGDAPITFRVKRSGTVVTVVTR
ncbi:MAG: hypothetical protein ABIO38_01120 [Luteimonas sp.]